MYVSTVLRHKGSETYSVAPDDSVLTALQLFDAKKIGFAVVLDPAGKALGGVSEREICKAMAIPDGGGRQAAIREVMTPNVGTCSPDDNLIRIMALMTEKRNRHMLVCDDDGLCGVISIGDVVKHRLDEIMREEEELLKYIDGTGYSV
ncbi:CBS domain-containing protein [Parasedimentitalea maritima]|uniref:CBS domain-containing protein n=1 Tax=Parasedimentitalea maritima TaxID=2578117 RepID=A0A6A4RK30_9RHOB|nr:CBS domain-containing protein [Zongyanglinia marina]KAE9630044.1 CBS domain-containing protein [Zongyanglinia marina]